MSAAASTAGSAKGGKGGASAPKSSGAATGGKADASAWIAVAAGTIGALMATLDTSIVNAALPTIQGEVGASGSEGTWISTAYLVAEIVMIPLAGFLSRALGLRTFLLIATTVFTACSVWCGVASSLPEMILGRIGQGFSGGAMIPTALSIIAKRLPPSQQPVGVALFGMTAILGPALGPVLGGVLTERLSWHYAFFINVPIGIGLIALLLIGLPADKPKLSEFSHADVLGILGLILGLGGLTTLLEEGQRELWFESTLIVKLSVMSAFGFALLMAGQFVAKRPVIRLRILLQRAFAGVFLVTMALGAALYGVLYLIPQFLTQVAGYNAEQSGYVAAISGVPTIVMMATFPFFVKHMDVRVAVILGLCIYALSCYLDSDLSPVSGGGSLFVGQLMRGVGMFFTLIFLNQAATSSVSLDYADDASGLFNAARNLGGSFGLAAIATLQEQRTHLHYARLAEALPANLPLVQESARLGLPGLSNVLTVQATVMTYSDLYWLFFLLLIGIIPLVLVLKPIRQPPASKK